MPELPEVESVRRSLAKRVLGRAVRAVELRRGDIVEGDRSPAALLAGCTIHAIERHGKQLALLGSPGNGSFDRNTATCVCVHLGMTGSLCHRSASREQEANRRSRDHVHVVWQLDDGSLVEFRDPRRFGGLWTFANPAALWDARWSALGEDALRIDAEQLLAKLARTPRPIKAALLDQNLVAGLGNIYVDEVLFALGVHPLSRSYGFDRSRVQAMTGHIRRILNEAIRAGGSTLRDYVDANGDAGGFQDRHKVYGRAGQACVNCGTTLEGLTVLGRTTVFCPTCQGRLRKRVKTSSEKR